MTEDSSWLMKYKGLLSGKNILEIGCGEGDDTKTLAKIAESIVAIDIDISRLHNINEALPNVVVQQADIRDGIFFSENQFSAVIASLSLHYFTRSQTKNILDGIRYTLIPDGILLVRVNSTKDINYGSVGYPEIESGLFDVAGQQKRFFSMENILDYFAINWQIDNLEEKTIDRYKKAKTIWEFTAQSS